MKSSTWRILVFGTLVLGLSIGMRLSFGLFLQPMSLGLGWGRGVFAMAIALQNLLWGLAQPFAGMLADQWGTRRVVFLGGIGYAAGLFLMSAAGSPLQLYLSAGLLVGLGLSGTSFGVVLGAVGRAVEEKRRSTCLGAASAGGSLGQFLILPLGQGVIEAYGWASALQFLGLLALLMTPLALAFRKGDGPPGVAEPGSQRLGEALVEAAAHRGYWLLLAGFFVCGFQVTFIATHLPAYVVDQGLSPRLGAFALALIGLFNIVGTFFWGVMGGRYSKKYNLASLYLARAAAIGALLYFPVTPLSVVLFSSCIGFLWLGTVPLTSGLIGQIFGVRFLATLFGIVFLSHQIGAFLGVWLGGYAFDLVRSYDPVWYLAIALSLVSALLHRPITEDPVGRLAAAQAKV